MSNYQLIKNTEWKEVEINGEDKEIPVDWECFSVANSIEMEKNTKISQIPTSLILNKGNIPVVGQEVEFISGFINNIHPLIATKNNPTIIFGDHSCTLKFITFNYVLGGDGTKVFKGNNKVKTNFLFYSIKNLNFNTDGYKRHFSILKEKLINIPPLSQQSAIASILSEQESVIENIEQLIQKYESRFQYLSDELLSGRLRVKEVDGEMVLYKNPDDNWKEVEINGEMKEIPSDWEVDKINKFIIENKKSKIKAGDLKKTGLYPAFNCSKELSYFSNQFIVDNENLFLSTGGMAAIHYYNGKATYSTDVYSITNNESINNKFLFFMLSNGISIINEMFYGAGLKHLNKKEFNNSDWFFPSKKEQILISNILTQQESLIDEQKQMLQQEKQKFDWLLDNLLSGKYLIKEN